MKIKIDALVESTSPQIESRKKALESPALRQALFQHFSPVFCFHEAENNFPVDPDEYIKRIIEVKREEYLEIEQKQGRRLTTKEEIERAAINKYFWNIETNSFDPNYKKHQNDPDFIKLTARGPDDSIPEFLIFNEKHYGYRVGEKIDVLGIAPFGHKNYQEKNKPAPITTSIFPTENGYFIQYQYLYSLNNAIYGLQWLRQLISESSCKRFSNFGFHYGDAEGVGIHVSVDDKGMASFHSMQTWAHGRGYAQRVGKEYCTFDKNGKVCVFVGVGGHPAYAHNFIGRNIAFDLVGDAYRIEPSEYIDVSGDVMQCALNATKNGLNLSDDKSPMAEAAKKIPGSISAFSRFADSNPLAYSQIQNERILIDEFAEYNNYHPWLVLRKIADFFTYSFNPNAKGKPMEPILISRLNPRQVQQLSDVKEYEPAPEHHGPLFKNSQEQNQGFFTPSLGVVQNGYIILP